MTRPILRARWLLGVACAAAVSCADSPTSPLARDDSAPDPVATTATYASTGRGQSVSGPVNGNGSQPAASQGTPAHASSQGVPAHANGNSGSPAVGNGASSGSGSVACGPEGSVATTDTLLTEPLPGDLCTVAQYLPGAPTPGRQMVSAFIDETGGSLRLGDFEIIVPAGAVTGKTRFAIMLPPPGHGDRAFAEFLPHNLDFAVPVTIRLPFSATNAAPGAPVTWWSQNGKSWVDQPTSATADGRIEAQVSHFSFYATRLRSGITIAGG